LQVPKHQKKQKKTNSGPEQLRPWNHYPGVPINILKKILSFLSSQSLFSLSLSPLFSHHSLPFSHTIQGKFVEIIKKVAEGHYGKDTK
jgi:hypothetical protein